MLCASETMALPGPCDPSQTVCWPSPAVCFNLKLSLNKIIKAKTNKH